MLVRTTNGARRPPALRLAPPARLAMGAALPNPSCDSNMPASIRPQPSNPRPDKASSSSNQPPSAANTVSRLRMIAAWEGGASR